MWHRSGRGLTFSSNKFGTEVKFKIKYQRGGEKLGIVGIDERSENVEKLCQTFPLWIFLSRSVALSCAIATLMLKIHSSKVLSWGTDVRKGCQNRISCNIKLLLHSAVCKRSNFSAHFYFPTAKQWLFLHLYGWRTVSLNVSTSAPCCGQWLISLFPPILSFLSCAHVHLKRLAACVWKRCDTTHKGW